MIYQLIHRILSAFFRDLFKRKPPGTITGKAWVIDGDTIKVSGQIIRLDALGAPELDQWAVSQDGHRFNHGKCVHSALIGVLGGQHVQVQSKEYDRYGRVVGTVTCGDTDIGAWLVHNGLAIAKYEDRYKHLESEARRERRGMWSVAEAYDPSAWRRGERVLLRR